jgi:hypothetical protein
MLVATKKGRTKKLPPPFLLLLYDPGSGIRNPEWIKTKPGSGINIPDPQQWLQYSSST